ncbi:cyclic AMP-dependent transcription factor ATF-4 [Arapaima gigas]
MTSLEATLIAAAVDSIAESLDLLSSADLLPPFPFRTLSLPLSLGQEDMGALPWGPSFLMADTLGPLLDEDEERSFSEGSSSPLSFSYADSTSPLPNLSPPSSPPCLLDSKPGDELLPLSWLDTPLAADGGYVEDAFSGMDWMVEKIDLSEFDLESLIGSCESDDSPSSPEVPITSLESDEGLDPLQFPAAASVTHEELGLQDLPQQEVDVKSEPPSPAPSPTPSFSPTFTLELGSEVDVLEIQKSAPTESVPAPQIVLSFQGSQILLVVSPKEEADVPVALSSSDDQSDSDSGLSSDSGSLLGQLCPTPPLPTASSTRTKPYSRPTVEQEPMKTLKSPSGAPKGLEKKLKKMEQNKTAATRYRQKKRAEQEVLNTEFKELEKRNRELTEKADSISKEIQYLKDLIEEVRAAKSKRNKPGSSAS